MLILGFYTTGRGCDVALTRDSEIVARCQDTAERGQDVTLPMLTRSIWTGAGIRLQDIDRIAVVTGPGSFTGIRLGVAFARGLALALDKPCLGVTSLEASLPLGQQGSAMVLLPAKRRPPQPTYWVQRFRSGHATGAPEECPLTVLQAELAAHPHLLFGDAASLPAEAAHLQIHPSEPSASAAAIFSADLDPDLHPPRPTYARAPDAAPPA